MTDQFDPRRPVCIDLFCGLGGWAEGFLAQGYDVIGFDIDRHRYPSRAVESSHVKAKGADWSRGDSFNGTTEKRLREAPLTGGWNEYPARLVLQDVLTLHGSQFRDAACIVASPPCQEFSYMAMPWKRAKQIAAALRGQGEFPEGYRGSRTIAELTALFDACFRIHLEACEAAGRYIPLVVENVKGAQPWVGKARANYGSFFLWGDVESVGGRIVAAHRVEFGAHTVRAKRQEKNGHLGGGSWFAIGSPGQTNTGQNPDGRKVPMNFHEHEKTGKPGRSFQSAAVESGGVKVPGIKLSDVGFNVAARNSLGDIPTPEGYRRSQEEKRQHIGHARKAASAQIAKIPAELAGYIARCFLPDHGEPSLTESTPRLMVAAGQKFNLGARRRLLTSGRARCLLGEAHAQSDYSGRNQRKPAGEPAIDGGGSPLSAPHDSRR